MSMRFVVVSAFLGLSLGALCSTAVAKPMPAKPKVVTLVVTGDVMLNRSNLKVDEGGVLEGNHPLPWAEMSAKIRHLIDGDLNFMNLETVVTDRNDLRPGDKHQKTPFLFRTHPNGVEHLLGIGFNLVSAANNHAYDYGEAGAKETVRHLQNLTEDTGAVYSGIGLNVDEASRPASKWVRGAKVAFGSVGIVTNMLSFHRAGPNKAGTMAFRHKDDWERTLVEMEKAHTDINLLSVHYGTEREIRTDERQRSAYRHAVAERGVDVVIGHHAHVVRGIEMHKGKLIFYGLGNFLIRGAANMAKKPSMRTCCDFGLLAKVHMVQDGKGYKVAAVEAVPVTDMHRIARPLPPQEAAKRIGVLNVLAEALDNPAIDSKGMRFFVRKDGTGLFCTPEAKGAAAPVAALCASFTGPTPPTAEVRNRVKAAPDPKKAKGKKGKKAKAAKRRRAKAARRRRNRRRKH